MIPTKKIHATNFRIAEKQTAIFLLARYQLDFVREIYINSKYTRVIQELVTTTK